MSLIILMIVVIVLLALVIYALQKAPIPQPFNWVLQVLAVVVAILVIGHRAGLF